MVPPFFHTLAEDLAKRKALVHARWSEGTRGQSFDEAWTAYQEKLLRHLLTIGQATGLRPQELLQRLANVAETLHLDPFSGEDQAFSAIAAFLQFDQVPPQIKALRNLATGQGTYSVLGAIWQDGRGRYWLHGYALGQSRPFPLTRSLYIACDVQGSYHVENLSRQLPLVTTEKRTPALPVASYAEPYGPADLLAREE